MSGQEFQPANQPKVILIGGCPGSGKTTLGRALAAKLGYASLTIDDLLNAVKGLTTPESHPPLHAVGQPNFTEYFTNSPVDTLTTDASRQHEALWPAVERTIKNRAAWGTPIVIDGWHLRPQWTRSLACDAVSAHWIVIDRLVLENRERLNTDFVSRSRNPEDMLVRFLARSFWHNDLIHREAELIGDHVLYQDGTRTVEDLCREVIARFSPS
jgi:2-phosphoglycerate kinase